MAAVQRDDRIAVTQLGPEVAHEDLIQADHIAVKSHGAFHVRCHEHDLHFFRFHRRELGSFGRLCNARLLPGLAPRCFTVQ